ncbi:X2-like carbohydrate binding domain-containing protein [Paenibacillus oryzisoli]|uniref:S-layer protein n=1 Tax=Paenibacillus oryzisoli TaxID=1850517 RepID=A0A197ZX12_9BACL|nr:X2-like carbohydrate binding domain-containing protein [Paenibacillus oryzisoli]OAS13351.1 hypothetical protein A8708_15950 [Paenibacillus oryzisoli]
MGLKGKVTRFGGRWVSLLVCVILAFGVLIPFGGQRASASFIFAPLEGAVEQLNGVFVPDITEYNNDLYLTVKSIGQEGDVVKVYKYNGSTWVDISGSGLQSPSEYVNVVINSHPKLVVHDGALYAYWSEYEFESKLRVKKYENNSWSWADGGDRLNYNPDEYADGAFMISFNGVLHAFWAETKSGSSQIRAKKLVGGTWVSADGGASLGSTLGYLHASISADVYNNKLYVGWLQDFTHVRVKSLESSGWQFVDNGGLSASLLANPSIRATDSGLFAIWADSGRIKSQKYNGSSWAAADNGLSDGPSEGYPVMTASNGTLYASYLKGNNGILLKRYDGSEWVAESDVLPISNAQFDMAIHNNDMYFAYRSQSLKVQFYSSELRTISPTTAEFDKNLPEPVAVTLSANGLGLTSITDDTTPLVSGTDYTVNGKTVTINSSYLNQLPLGTKTLTFNFGISTPRTLTLSIIDTSGPQNSKITPESGTFDKNITLQSPLSITMATYGNTLDNISDGSTALVSGEQYSVNSNTVTLNSTYLASLPHGTKTLTFNFSAGAPQTYTITVVDSTVIPAPDAPVLQSAVPADRQVTLGWSPVSGATGYNLYQAAASGTYESATPITVSGEVYSYTFSGLTNETTYYYIVKATNSSGESLASNELNARPFSPVDNSTGTGGSTPDTGVIVLVNGKAEQIGTASMTTVDGQKVTTVAIDPVKLEERLNTAGPKAIITIPITTTSDVVVGELNGQMISNLEKKQAILEIKTDGATYMIPAEQIDIDAILAQYGQDVKLSDIKIQIEIAKPSTLEESIVPNAAKAEEFSIVLPPLKFTVRGIYNGNSFEISKFDSYVERTIAIPDDVDASKITTAIVVDPQGVTRHVPTQVVKIDGKYYAIVNSLTNSLYTLIYHPITFKDVETHWAQEAVNNLGSRMIVNGVGNGLFNPNQSMTRVEFAAAMVRALGLKLENSATSPFKDVKSSDWFSGAVQTAHSYGLISGFEDGTFRPQESITREQAMVVIAQAMKITKLKPVTAWTPSVSDFTDSAMLADWAASSVTDMLKAGLVTGRDGSNLAPKEAVSRAEISTLVQRLLQMSGLIN